jgi:hypothetical protein
MNQFRIAFESFSGSDAQQMKSRGFLPFTLGAMPDVEHPTFRYAFRVRHSDDSWDYDVLRKELGEALDQAVIQWAVVQVEQFLQSGRMPGEATNEIVKLTLTEADLTLLRRMVVDKTCDYQTRSGRDLFCSAAGIKDPRVVGSSGLRRLAPTSRPMCRQCNLPDTDYICSRLTHPQVVSADSSGNRARILVGAYCEIGQPEIQNASDCRAGGHDCWARIVGTPATQSAAVAYTPRELPVALDFLDAVWKQTFGHPLVRLRSVEKTAALSLPCATIEEFRSRLGDLNELFKLMEIPDSILPTPIDPRQTFNRISACLATKIVDSAELENVETAMGDLHAINVVRNKLTHGGSQLAEALMRLGIDYPIRDYGQAWDQIRARTAAALTTIRSILQAAS